MRRLLACCLFALVLATSACGNDDTQGLADAVRDRAERAVGADEIRQRVEELKADAKRLRDRARDARDELGRRVRQVLDDIRKAVPEASLPAPAVEGPSPSRIATYLDAVIQSVDKHWTRTLTASRLPAP